MTVREWLLAETKQERAADVQRDTMSMRRWYAAAIYVASSGAWEEAAWSDADTPDGAFASLMQKEVEE